jgi:peptidoglycan/LPS O-acetylase OafA/YrhL
VNLKFAPSRIRARPHARNVILFLLSLACLWITKTLLSVFVLSSFSGINLTLEIDQNDRFFAYYSMSGNAIFSERRVTKSSDIPANKKTVVGLPLDGRIARKIRLDPGNQTGRVKLYHLKISSVFGAPIEMDAAQIFNRFEPNEFVSKYELNSDYVSFDIDGADPQLLLKDELIVSNRFVSYVLPIIMTLAFYLFFSSFRWRQFPAFSDLNRDLSSEHINYGALDGIRGIAVLLVLADHTLRTFLGAGTAGVWMFFVLSGFLLTIPFVDRPERAVSMGYMREYLLRRLKRLVPMYYVYIFVVFFVAGKYSESAVRHVLFMQGDGHLWTIQQELLFYLVLPLIMAVNYIVFRGRVAWIIVTLGVIMLAANTWLDKSVVSLYSVNVPHAPYVGIFACGMLFSYLYHGVILKHKTQWLTSRRFSFWASLTGILLLFTYVLSVTDIPFNRATYLAIRHPGWFGVAAGFLILLALMASGRAYSSLLSWTPFRAIGLVGYSFYLIHPVMIPLVTGMYEYYLGYEISRGWRFVNILFVSYIVSMLTYTYIERPFLNRG